MFVVKTTKKYTTYIVKDTVPLIIQYLTNFPATMQNNTLLLYNIVNYDITCLIAILFIRISLYITVLHYIINIFSYKSVAEWSKSTTALLNCRGFFLLPEH